MGSESSAFRIRIKLTRVQDIINKSTKLATDLCHVQDGPLRAQREIALSWVDINSHRLPVVLRCCAIWHARRWGDMYTSTPVTENHMIIPKPYISTREWFQIPTKRRTGSHTTSTGAAWVSPSRGFCLRLVFLNDLLRFQR